MPRRYSDPVYKREVPHQVYEGLIVLGIFLSAAGLLWVPWLFWLPLTVLVWGSFIEPRLLTVKRFEVGEGERKLRIAFLSDIHVGPYKRGAWIRKLVHRTNALEPDLILLGGDFIYDTTSDPAPLAGLEGLQAPCGTASIMGNHDFSYRPEETERILTEAGIPPLRNSARHFAHQGQTFAVVGIEDDWDGDTDFDAAMRDVQEDDVVIMLIHNPDLAAAASACRPDLMFSGHLHGGQIRLPFLGPVPRLPHHLTRDIDRGLFSMDGIPYLIGQGVGESGPRARLFCPPQILEVTLRF